MNHYPMFVRMVKQHRIDNRRERQALAAQSQIAARKVAESCQSGAFSEDPGHAEIQRGWKSSLGTVPERQSRKANTGDLRSGLPALFKQLPHCQGTGFAQDSMQGRQLAQLRRRRGGDAPEQFAQFVSERCVEITLDVQSGIGTKSLDAGQYRIHSKQTATTGKADEVTSHYESVISGWWSMVPSGH